MAEQRQRSERHVQISPYTRHTTWEPFHDWSFPTSRIFDQDFGMPLSTLDLERQRLVHDPWSSFSNTAYVTRTAPPPLRPTHALARQNSGLSQVSTVDGKFQIQLDVKHFQPEDINVKTVGDTVEILASHDEKQDDHGVISRNFKRKYTIPKEVDPLSITSYLSPEGILTVEAPLAKPAITEPTALPVQHEESKASDEKKEL